MPITASPAPYINPSMADAAMPGRAVGGVVGLQAHRHVPGQAQGVAKARDHFWQRLATSIRSWLRISLLTAATISGVRPGARACRVAGVAASDSSQSRKPPTVRWATGAKAKGVVAVDDQRVTSSPRRAPGLRSGTWSTAGRPVPLGLPPAPMRWWQPARPVHRPSGQGWPWPSGWPGRQRREPVSRGWWCSVPRGPCSMMDGSITFSSAVNAGNRW
jgi:hypothetical protein